MTQDDLTPSLVQSLRAGDGGAGELLDRLYREALARFAWGYLQDAQEAEDVAQEVFCKVMESDQVPDHFRAWIYRVARNLCLNRLRSRGRKRDRERLATGMDVARATAGALTHLVDEERRAQLAEQLARLGDDDREVLRLRYAEGLSRAEMAEVLELDESVVKSRLYEAVKVLRRNADD